MSCFQVLILFRLAPLPHGSPLLGRLLEEWGVLFEEEVLPRMEPASRAVLAQVNRSGRDAVRLPADPVCAPAGRTVGVSLKVVDFVGSAGLLAWARASGCPWVARTIHIVARGGGLEALQWAREHGCPWDGESACCWYAASGGHMDVVAWLIATGADVNYTRPVKGTTAVYVAAQHGHLDVVGWLLAAPGVDVNLARNTGATPIYIAAQNGHLDVVVRLITAPGADADKALTGPGFTPLMIAASHGHTDVVGRLTAAPGVDVNKARTDTGCTALYIAAQKGHLHVVERLLAEPGLNVNQARWDGATPLSIAILEGHQDVAQMLRAAGATEPHG
jgi:hypothetical protein